MRAIASVPAEQPSYPTNLLYCLQCELVQLGLTLDPEIIFPPSDPYPSGTTRILRGNFSALYNRTNELLKLEAQDLVVDIGFNDGTLLANFHGGGDRVLDDARITVLHAGSSSIITLYAASMRTESIAILHHSEHKLLGVEAGGCHGCACARAAAILVQVANIEIEATTY